jgi:hypothetical protein
MYRRLFAVLAILGLATSCARTGSRPAAPYDIQQRGRVVADAWRTGLSGAAGAAWRTGLVALQDLTVPPDMVLPDDVRLTMESGWYRLTATLPDQTPAPARVVFADGTMLPVPLVSARAAFGEMYQGNPPPCRQSSPPPPSPVGSAPDGVVGAPAIHICTNLTVTGVALGETKLKTSRGPATVPAWLFTVAELPAPIARVAVARTALSSVPIPSVPPVAAQDQGTVLGATRLIEVTGDRLTVIVGMGGCQRDPVGLSYESADVVVVAGSADTTAGECVNSLALKPVPVPLAAPLGDRVVLDAVTGRPLVLTWSRR